MFARLNTHRVESRKGAVHHHKLGFLTQQILQSRNRCAWSIPKKILRCRVPSGSTELGLEHCPLLKFAIPSSYHTSLELSHLNFGKTLVFPIIHPGVDGAGLKSKRMQDGSLSCGAETLSVEAGDGDSVQTRGPLSNYCSNQFHMVLMPKERLRKTGTWTSVFGKLLSAIN